MDNRIPAGPKETRRVSTDSDATQKTTVKILTRLSSPSFRLIVLVLLLATAVFFSIRSDTVGVESLRQYFAGFGATGPFVFAAMYALAATMMLPAAPFTIGAGLLFGPVIGTGTALIGATAGATGGFLLGRLLGRSAVEQFAGRRAVSLDRYLASRGFFTLLIIRLVPLFPFNLVNLVAGVTGIRFRDYVLATAVGIVPGTVAYAALGGTISDPTSPAFLVALAIFTMVTLGAGIASRQLRARPELAKK